ncbi:hypothetical protein C7447_103163 [Tenacibaculum adriaticum]|uniref:Uncharacterized protein n=1 Tax=Tenacibaculum adriaticum TaxID=413713 RepID=A0A5S5DQI8_9FLAO|nr:hypothetical protein C7447_103163 [Tenacibaculum adriaticum]
MRAYLARFLFHQKSRNKNLTILKTKLIEKLHLLIQSIILHISNCTLFNKYRDLISN